MKKLSLALVVILNAFFFSCNDKSDTVEPPPPPPTDSTAANAKVVTKTVLTSSAGTITKTYQYDAQNKLAWYSNTSSKAGYFEDTSRIVRDANGIISQIIYSSDTSRKYADPKLDTVVFKVFYDAAASKYTHKILQFKSFNVNFKDSTAYAYDAQNHINKEEVFYYDYKTTKQYQPSAKSDFTYDANGNVTKIQTIYYKVDNVNDYAFDINYTYDDTAVSLQNFGNEAILIGMQENFSAHAPKTMVSNYPETEYKRSLTYTYKYNTKNYPLNADITDAANNNAKSTLAFFYQ